jgi:hypothetical protein
MYQLIFMARYGMVLRGATSLRGALEGVGPENLNFFGPTPSNAPCNDVAPLKTITYCAIKTAGTLIVIRSLLPSIQRLFEGDMLHAEKNNKAGVH